MDLVRRVTYGKANLKQHPAFKTGDTVGVYVRVKEGEKERVQLFRGIVMKIQGSGLGKSFTVRKISSGVGVERIFPFATPSIDRIELIAHGQVRKGRLFFLRGLKGRAARLDSTLVSDTHQDAPGAADEIPVDVKEESKDA